VDFCADGGLKSGDVTQPLRRPTLAALKRERRAGEGLSEVILRVAGQHAA
jgi:hypothetical protein